MKPPLPPFSAPAPPQPPSATPPCSKPSKLWSSLLHALTLTNPPAIPGQVGPALGSARLGCTMLNGQPHYSVDGIGFTVDLTAILGNSLPLQLGGEVYVGGPNTSPPRHLFAGKLKGNVKGNAVEGLVVIDACGLRGFCFGLSGSEINISIGYGFVLTGARGGLSFANVSNDPCSFTLADLQVTPVAQALHEPSPYGSAALGAALDRLRAPGHFEPIPSGAEHRTPKDSVHGPTSRFANRGSCPGT